MKILIQLVYWIFFPIVLNACSSQGQCPAVQSGMAYLRTQYNPEIGLIREVPDVTEVPDADTEIYWLTNDNALAAFTFDQLGDPEFSQALTESINTYDTDSNGLIEIIRGEPVDYPPFVPTEVLIEQIGSALIKQEYHLEGARFEDWSEYANLAFLGALNSEYQGDHQTALKIYNDALQMYDGTGFADKAFNGSYETYKLALAQYSGSIINAPNPYADQMLEILLKLQDTGGGFVTHYTDAIIPFEDSDTNTETTSFVLLALNSVGCQP